MRTLRPEGCLQLSIHLSPHRRAFVGRSHASKWLQCAEGETCDGISARLLEVSVHSNVRDPRADVAESVHGRQVHLYVKVVAHLHLGLVDDVCEPSQTLLGPADPNERQVLHLQVEARGDFESSRNQRVALLDASLDVLDDLAVWGGRKIRSCANRSCANWKQKYVPRRTE